MPEIIPNLHPLLVHFPIVLVSVSVFFHVAALPTAFFGWQAFNNVNHDEAGHVAMLAHRAWALSTRAVLVVLAGWDIWRSRWMQFLRSGLQLQWSARGA